jgi:dienelactone hydrolase
MTHRTARLAVALLVLAGLVTAPAAAGAAAGAPAKKGISSYAKYAKAGPYAVGVVTLSLPDRKVDVWYPAEKKAAKGKHRAVYHIRDWLPPAINAILPKDANPPFVTDAYRDIKASKKGPFPLVVFAHGFAGYRDQSTFLTTHLASWGFVVAAPDFLERGLSAALGTQPAQPKSSLEVFRETLTLVRRYATTSGSRLRGIVKSKGKVAVVGHSAGARDAVELGAQQDVLTYVPLAGGGNLGRAGTPELTPPRKPSTYVAGEIDGVVPIAGIRQYYAKVPAPKQLVVIAKSGHLTAFSDICEIGAGGGGVVAIARQAGLPVPDNLAKLGEDGCKPPALKSTKVWPVTRHVTTAALRYAFRVDRKPVGLGSKLTTSFPGVALTLSTTSR